MEKVSCHEHGSLCLLKTGLRDGPNKGKSFYVCAAKLESPCGFTQPVDLPASHCLQHGDYLVELQALVKQDRGDYKLYYRCLKSKAEGTRWCGRVPWQSHKPRELPRNDKSQQAPGNPYQPKLERNPFKVLNENLKPSIWKQISEEREEKRMEEKQKEKEKNVDNEKKAPSESWRERDLPVGMKVKKTYERKRNDLMVESKRSEMELCEQRILLDGHISQSKLENDCVREHNNYSRCAGEKVDSDKQLASKDAKDKACEGQGAIVGKHRGSEELGAPVNQRRGSEGQGAQTIVHRGSKEQGSRAIEYKGSDGQGVLAGKHRGSEGQGAQTSEHKVSEQGAIDGKHRGSEGQGAQAIQHRGSEGHDAQGNQHKTSEEQGAIPGKHRNFGDESMKDRKHKDSGEHGLIEGKHRNSGEQSLQCRNQDMREESSLLKKTTEPQEVSSCDGKQNCKLAESYTDGKHRMAEKEGSKVEEKPLHLRRAESSSETAKEGQPHMKEGLLSKEQPNGTCKTQEVKAGVNLKAIQDKPECDRQLSPKLASDGTSQHAALESECTTTSNDAGEGGRASETDEEEVVFVSSNPGKGKSAGELVATSKSGHHSVRTSGGTVQRTITSFPGYGQVAPVVSPGDSAELHNQLKTQLKQKKATLATVNVQALPDKGQRLLKQVQDLEDSLSALNLSTPASPDLGIDVRDVSLWKTTLPESYNPFSRITSGPPSAVPLVKPLHFQDTQTSSLGLHGLMSTKTLGSNQHYSQVYGANPQMQGLYGGRMTEDRLYAVRNVTSDAIGHLHKSLESCPAPESTVEDPAGLKVPLLLHQKQALAWLLWREAQKPPGGILADDMGLGKTLTMIALILAQKRKGKEDKKLEAWISKNDSSIVASHATLIICPASLIHHWKKEVEKRVSGSRLKVYIFHGPNRERDSQTLSEYDIVVTTYSLVSREVPVMKGAGNSPAKDADEEDKSLQCSTLLRIAWARVILDEAHNIKNPKVQTSIAVCKLRAGTRWAVTGTPIQNNLLDMYSLIKFLRCSPFDEFKLWKNQVDNGSKKGGERLNILTKSLLLRRTKDQLDSTGKPLVPLPQRHCEVHRLKLSEDEQSVYNVLFARSRSTLQSYLKRHEDRDQAPARRSDNPFDRVAQEFGGSQQESQLPSQQPAMGSSTVHILSLLLRLRQCCCHLALLKMSLDQLELKNEGITLSLEEQLNALTLSELNTPDPKSMVSLNGTSFQADLFENTRESSKISCLLVKLNAIRSSPGIQKSVIVSQWTSMLKIVALHLKRIGLTYATIDGSVNPKLRMDMVEEFNNNPRGPQVMLVSLCAGGVGLNLIGGNHLFLLDMHWNPALEDQACDRIYRVGQIRDVVIHRFVCEETVEEKISDLQEKKKELAKKVLSGTGEAFTKLTLADLRVLFGV